MEITVTSPIYHDYSQRSLEWSQYFMSPKAVFYAACLLVILLTAVYVILDGVLRLVFWSCSSAVVLVTPETLPQKNDAG